VIGMADELTRKRIQRLRQSRRERGFKEANIWLEREIDAAIDHAVESGRFPSRQVAITHALATVFIERDTKVVM
jgi:hypothetical protein